MSEKEQKNQDRPTMADALRDMEQAPEPTQDEIVTQAMGQMSAQGRLEQPPQIVPDAIPENMKSKLGTTVTDNQIPTETISSQPEMMAETIPASSTDPQQAEAASTPESQETSPQSDTHLRRLINFIHGEEYSSEWVRMHLNHISRIPSVIPSMTLWDTSEDIVEAIYRLIISPGYVENRWPALKVVMGSSIDNLQWSAGVITTFALFDVVVSMLPGE